MESQDKSADNQEPKKEDTEMKEGDEGKDATEKPRNIQYDSKKWDEIMKQEEDDEQIEDAGKKDTPVVAKVLSLD
jgi:hypothetical protein